MLLAGFVAPVQSGLLQAYTWNISAHALETTLEPNSYISLLFDCKIELRDHQLGLLCGQYEVIDCVLATTFMADEYWHYILNLCHSAADRQTHTL